MKKDIILGCLVVMLLSSCGIRKVQTNKSTTKTDSVAVSTTKTDSVAVNTATKQSEYIQTEHLVDTSKTIAQNQTVIEFFNPDGKLIKRITSNTKKQKNKAKFNFKVEKQKVLAQNSSVTKTQKQTTDSVALKKTTQTKTKQSTAKRPNFLVFGFLIAAIAIMVILYNKK